MGIQQGAGDTGAVDPGGQQTFGEPVGPGSNPTERPGIGDPRGRAGERPRRGGTFRSLFTDGLRRYKERVTPVSRVAQPPSKPLLLFDSTCTFCRLWIARWKQCTGDRVEYASLQGEDIAVRFPELSREQLEEVVHLIEPDGRVSRGAEAVCRACADRGNDVGMHGFAARTFESSMSLRSRPPGSKVARSMPIKLLCPMMLSSVLRAIPRPNGGNRGARRR